MILKHQAAVPNWLREEIIKNKSVIASTYASHQSGSSHNSMGSEDDDKSYRKADQADKSVDSAKSTDDDEDDEVFPCMITFKLFLSLITCLLMTNFLICLVNYKLCLLSNYMNQIYVLNALRYSAFQ